MHMLWDILFRAEPIPPYPSSRIHNSRFMNRAVSVPGVSFHWLRNCWDGSSVSGIVWWSSVSLVSLLSSASWNFPGETFAASFCRKNNWIHFPRSMHTVGAFPCFCDSSGCRLFPYIYNDVIIGKMLSQITGVSIVCSTVCSDAD